MSSKPNPRRGHDRVLERGPRYENSDPAAGCNSTHVARARNFWRTLNRRTERRDGKKEIQEELSQEEGE